MIVFTIDQFESNLTVISAEALVDITSKLYTCGLQVGWKEFFGDIHISEC